MERYYIEWAMSGDMVLTWSRLAKRSWVTADDAIDWAEQNVDRGRGSHWLRVIDTRDHVHVVGRYDPGFPLDWSAEALEHLGQRIALRDAVARLDEVTQRLCEAIRSDDGRLPAYACNLPLHPKDQPVPDQLHIDPRSQHNGREARQSATLMIATYRVQSGQDPNASWRGVAALAASPATLQLAAEVNAHRDRVAAAAAAIPRGRRRNLMSADRLTRGLLLRQTTRHLVLLDAPPGTIRFSWAKHSRVVSPASAKDTRLFLADRAASLRDRGATDQTPAVQEAEALVNALRRFPDNEPIARVTLQSPNLIANIGDPSGQTQTRKIAAAILYPYDPDRPVAVNPLGNYDLRERRARRGDVEIEDHPILAGTPYYRYRPALRRIRAHKQSLAEIHVEDVSGSGGWVLRLSGKGVETQTAITDPLGLAVDLLEAWIEPERDTPLTGIAADWCLAPTTRVRHFGVAGAVDDTLLRIPTDTLPAIAVQLIKPLKKDAQ